MNLIFIYGPPGVGKLTTARELKKLTGYKLFHNHLVHDLLESVIDHSQPNFNVIKEKLYLEMLTLAAKEKTSGLIFTLCYAHPSDIPFINKVIKNLARYKSKISFVQIICDKNELPKRIKSESRKKYKKINTLKTLKQVLKQHELFTEIPNSKSLSIDNTKVNPKKSAQLIVRHYKLKKL